jgi:dTDP-4-amino-4,6-dideoxygalactose transaminase
VVKAIVPVHLFGVCANLTELAALAKSEQAALVEDAAQSLGARDSSGCIAGGMGEVGCFSFFPTKPLGAWGDGGAIVTDDDAVAQRLRRLRVHGATSPYIHETIGRNSRLDSIQAAVLWVKSRHLASWQRQRAYRATRYLEAFDGLPVLLPATAPAPALHAWHAFVIRVERDRDKLAAWLACRGVASRVYYPLGLHQQPCFLHLGEPSLPNSEMACQTALAIPISAALTDAEQDIVIEAVQSFFRC